MIKMFEDFNERNAEIDALCKKYGITNYTINTDGSIDVNDDVNLYDWGLSQLPLKFNRVIGNFDCAHNILTSLDGVPNYVSGNFSCHNNYLTSLILAPKIIGGGLDYADNPLPKTLDEHRKYIKYILSYQDDYGIWNKDGSFNEIRFNIMMNEKDMNDD